MKKVLIVSSLALVFLVGALIAVGAYFFFSYKNSSPSAQATEVIYEVSPGASFAKVAKDLETQGVISNAEIFSIYSRVVNQRGHLKAGEYGLRTNMTPDQVLSVITSGRSIERSLTISEGLNIYEISSLFEAAGLGSAKEFLLLVRDQEFIRSLLGENLESLEGYLYPETYKYNKFSTARSVVAAMVRRFLAVYSEIEGMGLPAGWDRHKVVTFASLVEKETGAAFERPLIASVFHNRIAKGMRLQTDPTIIYGKAELTGQYEIKISKSDILAPSRYNTYVIKGMPPGPIANPGREALIATLKPATSGYLFFVSQNDGTHVFSETYAQHSQAVNKFQKDPKAREGKSWRDLQKKQGN